MTMTKPGLTLTGNPEVTHREGPIFVHVASDDKHLVKISCQIESPAAMSHKKELRVPFKMVRSIGECESFFEKKMFYLRV